MNAAPAFTGRSGRPLVSPESGRVPRRLRVIGPGWIVFVSTLALCAIGVYTIALARRESGPFFSTLAGRQTLHVIAGLIAGAIVALPDYRWYRFLAWPALVGVVGLLIILLVPGVPGQFVTPRNGARCWIDLGPVDLQPSELCKIAYVLVLAAYFRRSDSHRSLLGLIPPTLITAVPVLLILMEPDLGTAILFLPTLLAMLVAAGARLKHLIGASVLAGILAGSIVGTSLFLAKEGKYPLLRQYQVARIQAVLERARGEEKELDARGFQGRQALIITGAGGLAGNEPARSGALVRFSGLPERHNDMIFAVLVNRFGLFGALVVLGLYIMWIGGALLVAGLCKEAFGRILIVGLTAMTATQMLVNVGMTIGLLPITGLTLPFVSYGGSSMIAGFIMVGLIVNVGLRRAQFLWRPSFEYDRADEEE